MNRASVIFIISSVIVIAMLCYAMLCICIVSEENQYKIVHSAHTTHYTLIILNPYNSDSAHMDWNRVAVVGNESKMFTSYHHYPYDVTSFTNAHNEKSNKKGGAWNILQGWWCCRCSHFDFFFIHRLHGRSSFVHLVFILDIHPKCQCICLGAELLGNFVYFLLDFCWLKVEGSISLMFIFYRFYFYFGSYLVDLNQFNAIQNVLNWACVWVPIRIIDNVLCVP